MKYKSINYHDDGTLSLILFTPVADCNPPREVKEFDRTLMWEYLNFPATQSMRIIGIDQENFEEVIDLLRTIKSVLDIPIACYYQGDIQTFRLKPFADIIINMGVL